MPAAAGLHNKYGRDRSAVKLAFYGVVDSTADGG